MIRFAILLLLPSLALAQTLQERLSVINSLAGQFEQRIQSDQGETLEVSAGSFRLRQPDLFRWHIRRPGEQLFIVSNGSLLHYDAELETASRNPLGNANLRSPLVVLGGDYERLEAFYAVEAVSGQQYILRPRDESSPLTAITLSFNGHLPAAMTLRDRLRQTTHIVFSQLQLNPPIDPLAFAFDAPPGVDYFDNAE